MCSLVGWLCGFTLSAAYKHHVQIARVPHTAPLFEETKEKQWWMPTAGI
jgi:hypothetical protein